jgi:hypothetical protein
LRLALGQVAAHREGGIRQVQGVFVISHFACSQLEEGPRRRGVGRDLRLEGVEIGKSVVRCAAYERNERKCALP